MNAAKLLLEALTSAYPPPPGQHHAIMLGDDEEKVALVIGLRIEGQTLLVHLDHGDLGLDPLTIAERAAQLVKQTLAPKRVPPVGS